MIVRPSHSCLPPRAYKGGGATSEWVERTVKSYIEVTNSLGRNLVDISGEVTRQQTVVTSESFPKIYRPANPTA